MTRLIARIRNTFPWIRFYSYLGLAEGFPNKCSWAPRPTGKADPATHDWEPLSKQLQNWSIG